MFLQTSQSDSGLLRAVPHGDNRLFPPTSPSSFSTMLRCDQDADPNALARVPAGLLPRTQVNQPLRVFPGLQGSSQLEKDYHKLMFTLWTPRSHLLKAPYHLPVCKQLEFGFLWTELTELVHRRTGSRIYNKYHQQQQENKQRKQLN